MGADPVTLNGEFVRGVSGHVRGQAAGLAGSGLIAAQGVGIAARRVPAERTHPRTAIAISGAPARSPRPSGTPGGSSRSETPLRPRPPRWEDPVFMSHPVISEIPTGPVAVPDVVTALAGGDTITPVWHNMLGGLTFRLDAGRRPQVRQVGRRRHAGDRPCRRGGAAGLGAALGDRPAGARAGQRRRRHVAGHGGSAGPLGRGPAMDRRTGDRGGRDRPRAAPAPRRAARRRVPVRLERRAPARPRRRAHRRRRGPGRLVPRAPAPGPRGGQGAHRRAARDRPPRRLPRGRLRPRTPCCTTTARSPRTSTSARSAWPTGGRTSPSRRGARSGTTARDTTASCTTRTGSPRTRSASPTTACSGTWRDPGRPGRSDHVPTCCGARECPVMTSPGSRGGSHEERTAPGQCAWPELPGSIPAMSPRRIGAPDG